MQIGDTIRVLTDEPSSAPIKAGTHGTVTFISTEGDIKARFPGGREWMLCPEDFEVIEIGDAFAALTSEVNFGDAIDVNALRGLYDAEGFAPLPGVPLESVEAAEPECAHDDEDEEDEEPPTYEHDDCPEEPHSHDDDGNVIAVPYLVLTDQDTDRLIATDIRTVTESHEREEVRKVALFMRIQRPSGDALEVHLSEGQAVALAAFLLKQYR